MSSNKSPYLSLTEAAHVWDLSLEAIQRSAINLEKKSMDIPSGNQRRDMQFSCRKVEGKDRVRRFIGSDESPDRYRTAILVSGWRLTNFLRCPSFLWCHNQDNAVPQFPIGKVVLVEPTRTNERGIEDRANGKKNALAFEVQFYEGDNHPTSSLVLDLYDQGYLNAVSVGFSVHKARRIKDPAEREALGFGRDEDDAVVIEEQELLELSAVPVPGNPNALMERMRSYSPTAARVFSGTPEDKPAWWAEKFNELEQALAAEADARLTEASRLATAVATAETVVFTDSQIIFSAENPPCDECDLAEALGARCTQHAQPAPASVEPTLDVKDLFTKVSELTERCSRLESEVKELREAQPAGGVPSDASPARSYLEEILDEVEAHEKLHGSLPRIK
jgi:hypothetical protein